MLAGLSVSCAYPSHSLDFENYEEHIDCYEFQDIEDSATCESVEAMQEQHEKEGSACDEDDGGGPYVEGPFQSITKHSPPGENPWFLYHCCYLRRRPASNGICLASVSPESSEETP